MIHKILSSIFINALIVYIIVKYFPSLGMSMSMEQFSLELFLLIGLFFWLTNDILKNILKIIALPVTILTLGLSSILINILIFYVFRSLVNGFDIGVTVELGNFFQVFFLSIVTALLNLLFKKI